MITAKALWGRGCGIRIPGKPYLCSGLGLDGKSIENFILDPPIPWKNPNWQRGYTFISKGGINHVIIYIGKKSYPSPWDFIEEARRYGTSQRVSTKFDFSKLTPGKSLMFYAHTNCFPDAIFFLKKHPEDCKIGSHPIWTGWHPNKEEKTCTFALKSLSGFHNKTSSLDNHNHKKLIHRPSFKYEIKLPKTLDVGENSYDFLDKDNKPNISIPYFDKLGIFLCLPITHIECKDSAPEGLKKAINQSGYSLKILDY